MARVNGTVRGKRRNTIRRSSDDMQIKYFTDQCIISPYFVMRHISEKSVRNLLSTDQRDSQVSVRELHWFCRER